MHYTSGGLIFVTKNIISKCDPGCHCVRETDLNLLHDLTCGRKNAVSITFCRRLSFINIFFLYNNIIKNNNLICHTQSKNIPLYRFDITMYMPFIFMYFSVVENILNILYLSESYFPSFGFQYGSFSSEDLNSLTYDNSQYYKKIV